MLQGLGDLGSSRAKHHDQSVREPGIRKPRIKAGHLDTLQGRCLDLIRYEVTDACTGCTICAQRCPAGAIPFTPYVKHEIADELCTRCDVCRGACPEAAIEVG